MAVVRAACCLWGGELLKGFSGFLRFLVGRYFLKDVKVHRTMAPVAVLLSIYPNALHRGRISNWINQAYSPSRHKSYHRPRAGMMYKTCSFCRNMHTWWHTPRKLWKRPALPYTRNDPVRRHQRSGPQRATIASTVHAFELKPLPMLRNNR